MIVYFDPFLLPFDRLPPTQQRQLQHLADDETFNPRDYLKRLREQAAGRAKCRLCSCRNSPDGICGYCRGRVLIMRAETTTHVVNSFLPTTKKSRGCSHE